MRVEVRFYPTLPDSRKSIGFWKVYRRRPFVLLVKELVEEDERGALVEQHRDGKTGSIWRKTLPSATFPPLISRGPT